MRQNLIILLVIMSIFAGITPVLAEDNTLSAFEEIKATDVSEVNNLRLGGSLIQDTYAGSWAKFENVDFGNNGVGAMSVKIAVDADNAGKVLKFFVDDYKSSTFAELTVKSSGSWTSAMWQEAEVTDNDVYGVHDVYVYYSASGTGNLEAFKMTSLSGADGNIPVSVIGTGKESRFKILSVLDIISWEENFDVSQKLTAGQFAKAALMLKNDETQNSLNELLERCLLTSEELITVEKACELIVKLLDRDKILNDYSSFFIAAGDAGIKCDAAAGDKITWLEAIDLLYTATEAEPVMLKTVMDADEHEKAVYTVKENNTILIESRNIHKSEGIVMMDGTTGLGDVSDITENEVVIGEYIFSKGECDITGLVGYEVEYYYISGDNENTLVYIEKTDKNISVTVNASDIESVKDGTFCYYIDDKLKKISLPKDIKIIYNGLAISKYDEETYKITSGNIEFISNDGDDEPEAVKIWSTTDYLSAGVFDDVLYLQNAEGKTISFKDSSVNYTVKGKSGRETDYNRLTENSVLSIAEVTSMKNGEKYYTISVSKSILSGVVESFDYDERIITVKGQKVKLSNALSDSETSFIKTGKEIKGYLNVYGELAFFENLSVSDKIGYLVRAWMNEDDENTYMRIFDSEGVMSDFVCEEKVIIDGVRTDEVLKAVSDSSGNTVQELILYSTSPVGQIRKITFPQDESIGSADNGLYYYDTVENSQYKSASMSLGGRYILSGDFILFKIPNDLSDYTNYFVTKNKFEDDARITMSCYSREKDKLDISLGVQKYDPANVTVKEDTDVYFVNSISQVYDEEIGDTTIMLNYYKGRSKTLESRIVSEKSLETAKMLKKADAIRFETDKDGNISNLIRMFSVQDKDVYNGNTNAFNAQTRITHGNIFKKQDNLVKLSEDGEVFNCAGAVVYVYDGKELIPGSLDDAFSSEVSGEGSEVFIYSRYVSVMSIIIVR